MPTDKELKHDFLTSLAEAFGPSFLELIQEPANTLVGERVLYKYHDDHAAERRPMTGQEFQSLRLQLENLAGEAGGTATLEPPDNSGLPHPRTVDIKECDAAMQIPAEKWVNSEELLPHTSFNLEWLLGIIHWTDYKELLFIDFTPPKVKSTFCADYDDLYDKSIGENMQKEFEDFLEKRKELIEAAESDPTVQGAKLASIQGKLFSKVQH